MEISITEALCIFNSVWRTEIEKELFDQSYNVIREEARRLHLIYQKQSIDKELKDLTKNNIKQANNGYNCRYYKIG